MSAPYENGFKTVLEHWESRRDPLKGAEKWLPDLDCDLDALARSIVGEESEGGAGYLFKKKQISKEFIGCSELALLCACLIAVLRKRDWPTRAPLLFNRLWLEQADVLLNELDMRWKVSAITTFGDHGQTELQRRLGQSLSVLMGTMKLYESERLFTGKPPSTAHKRGNRNEAPLPLNMEPYSIRKGGLDVNLLAPLWEDAVREPVMGPLAQDVLERLIEADNTVFARFADMRRRIQAKDSQ